jgi:hypothetical protein
VAASKEQAALTNAGRAVRIARHQAICLCGSLWGKTKKPGSCKCATCRKLVCEHLALVIWSGQKQGTGRYVRAVVAPQHALSHKFMRGCHARC